MPSQAGIENASGGHGVYPHVLVPATAESASAKLVELRAQVRESQNIARIVISVTEKPEKDHRGRLPHIGLCGPEGEEVASNPVPGVAVRL